VHSWQCSGAPVHDPETGATLGAIDVTGRYETAHPHNLALVQLAARLVQEQLRTEMLERDAQTLGLFADHTARHGGPAAAVSRSGRVLAATPAQWTPGRIELGADGGAESGEVRLADGTSASLHPLGDGALIRPLGPHAGSRRFPALRLELLGRDRVELHTAVTRRRPTARHSELAVLLELHPDGVDARSLAELLYGEPGHETAVRAELHRLPRFSARRCGPGPTGWTGSAPISLTCGGAWTRDVPKPRVSSTAGRCCPDPACRRSWASESGSPPDTRDRCTWMS